MIKLASLYKNSLQCEYDKIKYDDKYKFLFVHKVSKLFDFSKNTNDIEYVSIDSENRIIGYFLAEIDVDWGIVSNLKILNFKNKSSVIFSMDLAKFLEELFTVGKYRKLQFKCIIGNPIISTYEKYVKRFGGNEVGIFKNAAKLQDGKIYDYKLFEVFKEDFDRIEGERKNKRKGRIEKIEI